MAAVCNFFGLLVISFVSSAIAQTIFTMVDFGGDSYSALIALMAAMVAIIVWGVVAWFFGIPTSQSHSLIAGLTGAAIALMGSLDAINWSEWVKVIYGIVLSTLLGFGLGWVIYKILGKVFQNANRQRANKFFRFAQIVTGAGVAFMHGAQDGQKFMSIFMLAIFLSAGLGTGMDDFILPIWLMILCALSMGFGTAVGGERIIKNVGVSMVKLELFQGFAASLSTFINLMIATFGGLPVSTTHTNSTAIMGVGAAKNPKRVKWSIAIDMVKTWVLTFPGCGIMGFIVAKIFLYIL
jgi:PiT family inorganic phosphate transporter